MVVVVAIVLIRACTGLVSSDRPRNNYPEYRPPEIDLPDMRYVVPQNPNPLIRDSRGVGIVMRFTPEQVQAFEEYETDSRKRGSPPQWYSLWKSAGRPKAGEDVTVLSSGSGKEP